MKKLTFIVALLLSFSGFSQGVLTSAEVKGAITTLTPSNMQSRSDGNLPIQSLKVKRLRLDTLLKVASENVGVLVANKADLSYVNTQLATKTSTAQVNTIVSPKMDSTRVKSLLALKADLSALNSKVETSTFNSALANKANTSDLALKANTADVNALLNFKLNNTVFTDTTTALRNSINTKASIASVATNTTNIATNTANIATKASITLANQKLHTVATKTALIAFADADKCEFDGSTWERKAGNIASNGGSFAGTIINVNASFYWERKVEKDILPEWFGAIGNGTTDDITALNLAANEAAIAKKNLLLNKIYAISANVIIKNGVKKVYGGGTIKSLASGDGAGVYLAGKNIGLTENVSFCTIENLIFDSNSQSTSVAMIRLNGANNCTIQNNKIINVVNNYGILVQTTASSIEPCHSNLITNNLIKSAVNYDINTALDIRGISITSDFNILPYTDVLAHWKATFLPMATTLKSYKNTVSFNQIEGGYYGIYVSCSDENFVTKNTVTKNIRNVVVSNLSNKNDVIDNIFSESSSTTISISYSSSFNTFSKNKVNSSISTGESVMQAYVNCKSNVFSFNEIKTTSSPEYVAYTAVHCDGNEFVENQITSNPSKGFVGVESAWKTTSTNLLHSRYNKNASTNNFANTGSTGIVITGNNFIGTSATGAYVVLSQISDTGGNFALSNVTVENNTVTGSMLYQLYLWEDATNLTGIKLARNSFNPQATKSEFRTPRFRLHFSEITDNQRLNKGVLYEPLVGTTPDVSTCSNFFFNNTATTNVTNFLNGSIGQKIKIRMASNTIIIHDDNLIRLKNAANVNGSSNNFIEFENISNIWFETSRSF